MGQNWTAAQMSSQTGKRILITGANSGIGFQAALAFAQHGAHVLLGCRNEAKGEQALRRLQAEAPGSAAELVLLDVASLASVRRFAAEYLRQGVPLDVLVNNAGVMALPDRQVTEDGFERQFGTNHLGHFALTGLLLPALQRIPGARVVTVASLAHRKGKMNWEDLDGVRRYVPCDAYNMSKLANILFARELQRRLQQRSSTMLSVAVHPGVSRTNIFENGPGSKGVKATILRLFAPVLMQDDAAGAWPIEYAATVAEVEGGAYYGPDGVGELKGYPKKVQPRPQALDSLSGELLWQRSEELTGIEYLDQTEASGVSA